MLSFSGVVCIRSVVCLCFLRFTARRSGSLVASFVLSLRACLGAGGCCCTAARIGLLVEGLEGEERVGCHILCLIRRR